MTDLISHWARRRPHEAAEALEKLPGGFVSDHARQTLAEWWARDDPAAALGWARQIEDPVRRRDVVLSALASWADTGTHAATNYALGLPAGHERDEALLVIAPRIAQQNLEEALQLVEQISDRPEPRTEDSFSFGTRREDALYMIVQTLSKTDPETAASLIARLPPGDARNNAADQVAQNWPGEYSAGLEWARALPPNHARERAIEGFLRRWSQHDAKAALSWMIQNEPPGPNGWGADEHLRALGEQNGAEIIEWLRIFPDGATKRMLLNTAIDGLARSDPERAAELFTTELSPDAQSRVADNLTYQWARKEPASAAAWALQFPEGKTRAEAAYGVAAIWSETDPAQTAAWLERLPPGETRERAVLTFAGKVAEADPESALTWMLTLTDNKARDAAMEPALEHWMTRDHAAAQRWMERNPTVPAEMRERLRRSKP